MKFIVWTTSPDIEFDDARSVEAATAEEAAERYFEDESTQYWRDNTKSRVQVVSINAVRTFKYVMRAIPDDPMIDAVQAEVAGADAGDKS